MDTVPPGQFSQRREPAKSPGALVTEGGAPGGGSVIQEYLSVGSPERETGIQAKAVYSGEGPRKYQESGAVTGVRRKSVTPGAAGGIPPSPRRTPGARVRRVPPVNRARELPSTSCPPRAARCGRCGAAGRAAAGQPGPGAPEPAGQGLCVAETRELGQQDWEPTSRGRHGVRVQKSSRTSRQPYSDPVAETGHFVEPD